MTNARLGGSALVWLISYFVAMAVVFLWPMGGRHQLTVFHPATNWRPRWYEARGMFVLAFIGALVLLILCR